MEERLKKSIIENVPVQDREITIYTDLKVDQHDFNIRERRNAQRAISATQRPKSTFRSQKSIPPSGLT